MQIALGSIFRNSTSYLSHYFSQVSRLAAALVLRGHDLRLLLAEGDSTDGTYQNLKALAKAYAAHLIQVNHGGGDYGHIAHADRWRNISTVCNALLELVEPSDDVLIYVESDLIWQTETMLQLLRYIIPAYAGIDVVSPLCIGNDGRFYDVWGYRKNGVNFGKEKPYHPDLSLLRLTQIDSAGSCLVMTGKVARECRFNPPELGIVGWCQDIREHGYTLWIDASLEVKHP